MNYLYLNRQSTKREKKYIPVKNLPKPLPPKHWKPTKEEIMRNTLLRSAYGIDGEGK